MQNPLETVMAGVEKFITKAESDMAALVKPVLDEVASLRAQIVEFGHRAVADASLIGGLEAMLAEWEARVDAVVAPLRGIVADSPRAAPDGLSMQDHGGIAESVAHAA